MKLSNYERETIFLFNEAERKASIFTYNDALKKQLAALCESYPEQVRRTEDNGCGGETYELPKKWLKIKPPRILSAAQREVVEQMNKKRWGLTAQAVCLDIYRFSPFTMSAMLAIWLSVSDFISSASAPAAVGLWLSASKNSCGEMPK